MGYMISKGIMLMCWPNNKVQSSCSTSHRFKFYYIPKNHFGILIHEFEKKKFRCPSVLYNI